jgi:hypothetical protein
VLITPRLVSGPLDRWPRLAAGIRSAADTKRLVDRLKTERREAKAARARTLATRLREIETAEAALRAAVGPARPRPPTDVTAIYRDRNRQATPTPPASSARLTFSGLAAEVYGAPEGNALITASERGGRR